LVLNRLLSAAANITGLAIDSSDNIIGVIGGRVFKMASGGSITWSNYYGANASAVATDGSNIYAVAPRNFSGIGAGMTLYKIDSSGSLVWQRSLAKSGLNVFQGARVEVDSAGNIVVGGYQGSVDPRKNIAKYDTDGTLLWQRQAYFTNTQDIAAMGFGEINFDASDNLLLAWEDQQGGVQQAAFGLLPSDGSLTGSYSFHGQTFYWLEDTCSAQTTTDTASSAGYSANSSSLSTTNTSYTLTASSVTSDYLEL
jgi:hypothetical protein